MSLNEHMFNREVVRFGGLLIYREFPMSQYGRWLPNSVYIEVKYMMVNRSCQERESGMVVAVALLAIAASCEH